MGVRLSVLLLASLPALATQTALPPDIHPIAQHRGSGFVQDVCLLGPSAGPTGAF